MINTAQLLGRWGSLLGLLAGIIELSIGSSILPLIGYKENPVVLGLITMLLSSIAYISVFSIHNDQDPSNDQKLLTLLGILVPAVVCFTTVGVLWFPPGTLLLSTSYLIYVKYWHTQSPSNSANLVQNKIRFNKAFCATGIILVLTTTGLSIFGGAFSFYKAEILKNGSLYKIEVIPMDIMRIINVSNNIVYTQDSESLLIMSVYICLFLGLALSIISYITNSRLFLSIGGLMILLGLTIFIFWHPDISTATQSNTLVLRIFLKELGLNWYISFLGLLMIFLSIMKVKVNLFRKVSKN